MTRGRRTGEGRHRLQTQYNNHLSRSKVGSITALPFYCRIAGDFVLVLSNLSPSRRTGDTIDTSPPAAVFHNLHFLVIKAGRLCRRGLISHRAVS